MRPLIVLAAMLFCFGGLQGDLTAQEDEPETVVVSVDSTNLRFSPSWVMEPMGEMTAAVPQQNASSADIAKSAATLPSTTS